MRKVLTFGLLIAAVVLSACGSAGQFFATETPIPTNTFTPTPTSTITPTPRPTNTPTPAVADCQDISTTIYNAKMIDIFERFKTLDLEGNELFQNDAAPEAYEPLVDRMSQLLKEQQDLEANSLVANHDHLFEVFYGNYLEGLKAFASGDIIAGEAYMYQVFNIDLPKLTAEEERINIFCGFITPESTG